LWKDINTDKDIVLGEGNGLVLTQRYPDIFDILKSPRIKLFKTVTRMSQGDIEKEYKRKLISISKHKNLGENPKITLQRHWEQRPVYNQFFLGEKKGTKF